MISQQEPSTNGSIKKMNSKLENDLPPFMLCLYFETQTSLKKWCLASTQSKGASVRNVRTGIGDKSNREFLDEFMFLIARR